MRELLSMLEHRIPNIRSTDTWRKHTWRWVRNYEELQYFARTKPDLYQDALIALVNHIANRAARELELEISFNEEQRHTNAAKQGKSLRHRE